MQKRKKWDNFDACEAEALKYDDLTEFRKGSSGAYNFARNKSDWLERITIHMRPLRTLKHCCKVARQYKSRGEFKRHDSTIYDCCRNREGCLDKACEHMPRLREDNK